jgi:hypothetical protein
MPLKPGDSFVNCPAIGHAIDRGLCWEYALAGRGGPADTATALTAWIRRSDRFETLDEFHAICEHCRYHPW